MRESLKAGYIAEAREKPHTTGGTTLGASSHPPRSSNLYLSNAHVYNSSKYPTHPTIDAG
jgi:hypothetical protein